jgi:hypothetical protein
MLLAGLTQAQEIPENAHVSGSRWYCNAGFTRVGDKCEALQVPENGYVLGNAWYCKAGFERVGSECEALRVPENGHVLGNAWYCNAGFKRVGDECEALRVPENGYVLGNAWYCNAGFKRVGDRCIAIEIPPNAHVQGSLWYCDEGYRRVRNKCEKMTPEEVHEARAQLLDSYLAVSDGSVAHQTRIESERGEVLLLENGAIVEIDGGYVGYIGYRQEAVLFGNAQHCKIWIEGKRVFSCDLLKEPSSRGSPAKEVYISEVKGDGAILLMLDGSIYEVDSLDQLDTYLWLGLSDALLVNGEKLLNFDEGALVTVSRIR